MRTRNHAPALLCLAAPLLIAALACNLPSAVTDSEPATELPAPEVETQPPPEPTVPEPAPAATEEPTPEPPPGILPAALYFLDTEGRLQRIEVDAETVTPVIDGGPPVTDYDVSPFDGRIAFVSANDMLRLDGDDAGPVLLADGPDVAPDAATEFEQRVTDVLSRPRWSPDGAQIAFGWGGVRLMSSNGGSAEVLVPSDPPPDLTGAGPLPEGPIRFFWPEAWSPDGTQLLSSFGFFPEGGGLSVVTMADRAVADVTSPAEIVCCNPSWDPTSQFVYFSNGYGEGPIPPGSWRYEPASGESIEIGAPAYFYHVLPEGRRQVFLEVGPDDATQPVMGLFELGGGGPVVLREDNYFVVEPLWDDGGGGVAIVDISAAEAPQGEVRNGRPVGQLWWLPGDGSAAVRLPGVGNTLRWAVGGDANPPPTPISNDGAEAEATPTETGGLVLGPEGWPVGGIPVEPGGSGTIGGAVSYPSESIPKMRIYAVGYNASEEFRWYWVGTATNQQAYSLEVEPGVYFVYAYTDAAGIAGGYTRAVPCGLTADCTDHRLIPVQVDPEAAVGDVDVTDWYAPPNSFPRRPDQ